MTVSLERLQSAVGERYRIERELGAGGMSVVFLATDLRHDRRVAMKVLAPGLIAGDGDERFLREIRLTAGLQHPHILPLFDSGSAGGYLYYVMPFVEGESLRDRLQRDGHLGMDEAIRLTAEVADALDYANARGIIHRDIKPENILLSGGHAIVADFGIARALHVAGRNTLTGVGEMIGTPAYMSPEQFTGGASVDARTDVYALGCTLFEVVTGRLPWPADSFTAAVARRMVDSPPSAAAVNAGVPGPVDSAIRRSLAVNPKDRFATAGAMARALTDPGATVAKRGRPRWVLVTVAAVLLVAAFLVSRAFKAGSPGSIMSLAIAPLSHGTEDSTVAYLREGIEEAVADLLRQIPRLRVTAPSLVAQVRAQEPSLTAEELGRRLGVGAVLTWRFRPAAAGVVLRTELLRVPGGSLLWAATYQRPVSEVLALQRDIAKAISDSLRLELTGTERAAMERRPTASAEAYELYLRGRFFDRRSSPLGARRGREDWDSARVYAIRALQIDSTFAAAQGLLANYYQLGGYRGWITPIVAAIDTGFQWAARALARDSSLGDAWSSVVGWPLYVTDNWVETRDLVDKSVRHAGRQALANHYAAIYYGEVEGRLDSAIAYSRRASEIEPTTLTLNTLGDLYMRARQYDSAVAVLQRALSHDPTPTGPNVRLIQSLERMGRYEQAVTARTVWRGVAFAAPFAKGLDAEGPAGYGKALERDLRARVDSLTRAALLPPSEADTVVPLRETRLVLANAQLGDWERALDWIEREYARRPGRFRLWLVHPDVAPLWNHPRLLALARREGLDSLLRRPR